MTEAAAAPQKFKQPFGLLDAVMIVAGSIIGCNNGLILAGAMVYYTMAKDRLFFKQIGHLNCNAVPFKAI